MAAPSPNGPPRGQQVVSSGGSSPSPVGRLCFRCGVALSGPAVRDPRGREVCIACAPKPAEVESDGPAAAATADASDERVVIDLGASSPLPPIAAKPRGTLAHTAPPPVQSDASPLPVVDLTPAPMRLAPARPAPELEDVSKYAPANQYRPRVPSTTPDDEKLPERKCSKCGYSLEGLEGDRCPECGHVNRHVYRAKSRVLADESRQIERMEYLKPTITLGAGVVLVVAILGIGGNWESAATWAVGLPLRVVMGTVAFFLCCLWFFGFDSPWRLTMLRLAATYAIADVPVAMVRTTNFLPAMPLAYVVSFGVSAFMLVWLFELDPSDAWVLVAVSTVVSVVIGMVFAVLVSMVI